MTPSRRTPSQSRLRVESDAAARPAAGGFTSPSHGPVLALVSRSGQPVSEGLGPTVYSRCLADGVQACQ